MIRVGLSLPSLQYVVRSFVTAPSRWNILKSPVPDLQLKNTDIMSTFLPKFLQFAKRDAIECTYTGIKYTYKDVLDGSLRISALIMSLVSRKEDLPVVAIYSGNVPEYPIYYFGTISAGCTIALLSALSTKDELTRLLNDCRASVLIVDHLLEATAQSAVAETGRQISILVNGPSLFGKPNLKELILNKNAPLIDPVIGSSDDIALLPYSSGTTGKPKGVAISHKALTNNLQSYMHKDFFIFKDSEEEQVNATAFLPFSHTYGFFGLIMSGFCSGTKLLTFSFEPKHFVKTIKKYKVPYLHVVPPIVNFLINSPAVTPDDLRFLKSVLCAGAPLLPTEAKGLKEKAFSDLFIQEGYGMTENLVTNVVPMGGERIGYVGVLLPNVTAVVVDNITGEKLGPGKNGELCVKSSGAMSYYLNNPQETRASYDSEGWFHTGDIVEYTEDGYFKIVDRIKELIKVKGLQVSPTELEETLIQHPAVADAGVVPIPDQRDGEHPRAYVVLNEAVTEAELEDFMAQRLAPYKQLTGGITFVASLPKSATGKLLRRQLKERAAVAI